MKTGVHGTPDARKNLMTYCPKSFVDFSHVIKFVSTTIQSESRDRGRGNVSEVLAFRKLILRDDKGRGQTSIPTPSPFHHDGACKDQK